MAIRLKIKEVAKEKKISMALLSRKANVNYKTIQRIYRDPYTNINMDTLGKIAEVLGVQPGDLIERE